jgi:hypothetical protein
LDERAVGRQPIAAELASAKFLKELRSHNRSPTVTRGVNLSVTS